jgi:tetratricopeptide (TPR) repeat protein
MLVLEWAVDKDKCANASYYLGCIYYDRKRYDDACAVWEACVAIDCENGAAWRNLALYYFDKMHNGEKAKAAMEKALEYKREDPRILFEYQQLLKNMGCSPEERLAVYEQYADLLALRDDCYLDKVFLTTQIGDFKGAIDMAAVKRFHIYEGGEGKLTKLHAWMHVLYGAQLLDAGKADEASAVLENGVNMPKSYGEAKTFFNQEAHIYYNIGLIAENAGDSDAARAAFEKAAEYKAAVSPISLWRALALFKLGDDTEAKRVLDEMIAVADNKLANRDLRTYYGVGSPSPMPFEYDIIKQNTCEGSILKAFALLGYGKLAEAEEIVKAVRELDPYNFDLFIFDAQKGRINI